MELLLRRLDVGVIARLDIVVLRGQTQIVFRRSGGRSLLVAGRYGRLNPVETGLEIHSGKTARINRPAHAGGVRASPARANISPS